jgi:hypothetical protein
MEGENALKRRSISRGKVNENREKSSSARPAVRGSQ